MASDIREADVHEILERRHARYEIRPYYIVLDQRPVGAPPILQKVQAGFDVDLYASLEKEEFPFASNEQARMVLDYFEAVAREKQVEAGHHCMVEIIPFADSVFLDQHLKSQAMLRIRITHDRGLGQPAGPPEDEALKAIRETLHGLAVREA